jgi:hypothetical protein
MDAKEFKNCLIDDYPHNLDLGMDEALGMELRILAQDAGAQSDRLFGDRATPVTCMKHAAEEALEAVERPNHIEEYADNLLCLLDGARRAGLTVRGLIYAAHEKLSINATRKWIFSDDPNEPAHHDRTLDDA